MPANERVFGKQIEPFVAVIDALLKKPSTRAAFTKDPMGTLEAYGVECLDPDVRAKLAHELRSASTKIAPDEDAARAVPIPFVVAVVAVEVAVGIGGKCAEPMFRIDQGRVDMFLDSSAMQDRIRELEAEVSRLRDKLNKA